MLNLCPHTQIVLLHLNRYETYNFVNGNCSCIKHINCKFKRNMKIAETLLLQRKRRYL